MVPELEELPNGILVTLERLLILPLYFKASDLIFWNREREQSNKEYYMNPDV